jgi:hypothetical protein
MDTTLNGLVNVEGGHNETWWKIQHIQIVDDIVCYPAIVCGKVVGYCDFFRDARKHEDYEIAHSKYLAAKQKRVYYGYRLIVSGNGVSAEYALQEMGYDALNVSPNCIEIKVAEIEAEK